MNTNELIAEMERTYNEISKHAARPSVIYITLIRYSRIWRGKRFVYLHHPIFDWAKRA